DVSNACVNVGRGTGGVTQITKGLWNLSTTIQGSGSVTKSPNSSLQIDGSVATLTATAVAGWHFVGWSGDASGSASPLSVTMNANKTIQASFASNLLTLIVTVYGGGTVNRNPDQPTYGPGTVVRLTAIPSAGRSFIGWRGDASGLANPLDITMN